VYLILRMQTESAERDTAPYRAALRDPLEYIGNNRAAPRELLFSNGDR
jgi:hypothetical protein